MASLVMAWSSGVGQLFPEAGLFRGVGSRFLSRRSETKFPSAVDTCQAVLAIESPVLETNSDMTPTANTHGRLNAIADPTPFLLRKNFT
jgi:hypothetical protein